MFNIFFIAFAAVGFGLALAILITRKKPPGNIEMVPPEEDFDRDTNKKALTMKDLFELGKALCKQHGLTLKEEIVENLREVYWVTESKSDFFFGTYVLGFYDTDEQHRFITMAQILELKDFIKSVRGAKGFAFTTGFFTRDVHQPLEGPSVTLYNKTKVIDFFHD